jgi:hypothetical protein
MGHECTADHGEGGRAGISPYGMLWAQVVLLDIAIRLHIRGSVHDLGQHPVSAGQGEQRGQESTEDAWIVKGPDIVTGLTRSSRGAPEHVPSVPKGQRKLPLPNS